MVQCLSHRQTRNNLPQPVAFILTSDVAWSVGKRKDHTAFKSFNHQKKHTLFEWSDAKVYRYKTSREAKKKIKIKYFKPLSQIAINQYLLLSVSIRKRNLRLISAKMRSFKLQVSSVQSKLRTSKQREKSKIISDSNCRLKDGLRYGVFL